jgi:phosphomannomutase
MVRPSGTEPIVRIYVEAESREKLDILMSKYLAKVNSIISQ